MNAKKLQDYASNKPEAVADYPFGPDVLVYKVHGKMFALIAVRNNIEQVNLKCEPSHAFILRDIFTAVIPGYHMNKTHWNTVLLDGSIPSGEIERMVDHSYSLVVKGLVKKTRQRLELVYGAEKLYRD